MSIPQYQGAGEFNPQFLEGLADTAIDRIHLTRLEDFERIKGVLVNSWSGHRPAELGQNFRERIMLREIIDHPEHFLPKDSSEEAVAQFKAVLMNRVAARIDALKHLAPEQILEAESETIEYPKAPGGFRDVPDFEDEGELPVHYADEEIADEETPGNPDAREEQSIVFLGEAQAEVDHQEPEAVNIVYQEQSVTFLGEIQSAVPRVNSAQALPPGPGPAIGLNEIRENAVVLEAKNSGIRFMKFLGSIAKFSLKNVAFVTGAFLAGTSVAAVKTIYAVSMIPLAITAIVGMVVTAPGYLVLIMTGYLNSNKYTPMHYLFDVLKFGTWATLGVPLLAQGALHAASFLIRGVLGAPGLLGAVSMDLTTNESDYKDYTVKVAETLFPKHDLIIGWLNKIGLTNNEDWEGGAKYGEYMEDIR